MRLNTLLIVLAIFLLDFSDVTAQEVEFTLKVGEGLADPISSKYARNMELHDKMVGEAHNIAIQAAAHGKQGLFLTAEIGYARTLDFVSFTTKQDEVLYTGSYRIRRFYSFLGPEYRFFKKKNIFVNAQIGLIKDYDNAFINGTRLTSTGREFSLAGKGEIFSRIGYYGYAVGAGAHLAAGKRWGVLLETRLLDMTDGANGLGYLHYVFNIGLTYRAK